MRKFAIILCALLALADVHSAQAAPQTTYDLTFVSYESMFSKEDNDVFLILYTADNSFTFRLDIIVEDGQQFFTSGKTYTWADMLTRFCYTYVSAEYAERPFKDANFTWTKDEQGLEHMRGYAVDTLGNTYNFHYDVEPFIPTGDTIAVSMSQSLRLEHAGEWYFSGSDSKGKYSILFTLLNDGNSPVGHYTAENIDLSYSFIGVNPGDGTYQLLTFHDAEIDVVAAPNDTLRIEATITAEDGNVYLFHMFYAEPKPIYQQTITATDMYINTDYLYGMVGAFRIEATGDEYSVFFALTPMSEDMHIYDTYHITNQTNNTGGVTPLSDPETIYDIYEGTITLAKTEKGALVTGKILCYNNTEYTINLSYYVPETTREAQLVMDDLSVQISNQGAWRLSGYSQDSTQYVSLVFNNWQIAGTYSLVEMGVLNSYVVTDIQWGEQGEAEAYTYFDAIAADLTAVYDEENDLVRVSGTVTGQNRTDIPLFHVELSNQPAAQALPQVHSTGATAAKRLIDGTLVIERNGVRYTVSGVVLKE